MLNLAKISIYIGEENTGVAGVSKHLLSPLFLIFLICLETLNTFRFYSANDRNE